MNPELGDWLSLASQLAQGPVSTFQVLELQTSCHSRPALYMSLAPSLQNSGLNLKSFMHCAIFQALLLFKTESFTETEAP